METQTTLRGLDWGHIRLSYVTHFYLNKNNGGEILSLFDDYAQLPADILDRVLFVVVDDGSPAPYELKNWPLNMIILRVQEDIPWNNPGARNLGMVYAKSDKVFVADIDHALDEKSFRTLLKMPRCGRKFWRLPRRDPDGRPVRAHANTFLLSRGFFLKYFGYDEALCGHYACDDTFLAKYFKQHGMQQWLMVDGAVLHQRRFADKGSTHTLDRDMTHNKALVAQKIREMRTYGPESGHSREFLNFEWKIIQVTRREVPSPEKKNKLWALGWWGRWIFGER
jgi:hypothetical protein